MPTIADIRAQYPQYQDLSDDQLAKGFHQKFYADIPFADFAQKIGYDSRELRIEKQTAADIAAYSPAAGESGFLPVRIPGTQFGVDIPVPQSVSNFGAAGGKAVSDLGRSLRQIQSGAIDLVTGGSRGDALRQEQDEAAKRDAALMNTKAGVAGNIAGNLALAVLPGGVLGTAGKVTKAPGLISAGRSLIAPTTIRGGAALGAGTGALQPVGTDESRTANALVGGVLGGGVQGLIKGAARLAQPVKTSLSRTKANAVKTLQDAGVPLDAAQVSGSERAAQVKRFLTDNPLTGPGQVRQAEKTQTGFTRAALETIGAKADEATPEVLDRALKPIERTFSDVASRNTIQVSDPVLDRLANLSEEAKQILEAPQAAQINRQIDEIIAKAAGNGSIPGKTYQNLRTTIGTLQRVGSAGIKEYGGKLLDVIDDALERSVSGADLAAIKDARIKYRNFNGILDAVMSDTGTISAPRLYQALNKKAYGAKKALKTGRGQTDLFKLARAGRAIIPEKLPNSGTAPRALLQAAIPGLAGAGYGVASEGDLGAAAKYGLVGAALPFGAQRFINSPGGVRYLTQGVQSPLARRALLAPSSQSLPAGALRQLPAAGLLSLYGAE